MRFKLKKKKNTHTLKCYIYMYSNPQKTIKGFPQWRIQNTLALIVHVVLYSTLQVLSNDPVAILSLKKHSKNKNKLDLWFKLQYSLVYKMGKCNYYIWCIWDAQYSISCKTFVVKSQIQLPSPYPQHSIYQQTYMSEIKGY